MAQFSFPCFFPSETGSGTRDAHDSDIQLDNLQQEIS